jgi:predicted ribosomally synthesized peptide with nif11-like leader
LSAPCRLPHPDLLPLWHGPLPGALSTAGKLVVVAAPSPADDAADDTPASRLEQDNGSGCDAQGVDESDLIPLSPLEQELGIRRVDFLLLLRRLGFQPVPRGLRTMVRRDQDDLLASHLNGAIALGAIPAELRPIERSDSALPVLVGPGWGEAARDAQLRLLRHRLELLELLARDGIAIDSRQLADLLELCRLPTCQPWQGGSQGCERSGLGCLRRRCPSQRSSWRIVVPWLPPGRTDRPCERPSWPSSWTQTCSVRATRARLLPATGSPSRHPARSRGWFRSGPHVDVPAGLAARHGQLLTLASSRLLSSPMSLDQLKAFLRRMQDDPSLRQRVLAAATADDVAQIALQLGFEFSGDELLRVSGQKFDRVTVHKNDIPGEYN